MDEPVSFEIESDAEQVATHQLRLYDIRADHQFISDIRGLDIVDYTAQYSTGNMSFIDLYMMRFMF